MYVRVYVYICIYIFTYMYIYTYIYMYILYLKNRYVLPWYINIIVSIISNIYIEISDINLNVS